VAGEKFYAQIVYGKETTADEIVNTMGKSVYKVALVMHLKMYPGTFVAGQHRMV
jgi:hypothetical protein